jgi:hypothetical protein
MKRIISVLAGPKEEGGDNEYALSPANCDHFFQAIGVIGNN